MNRNLKLEERIQILVLYRQGFNITQISDQLNVSRSTARRWIQRNEEEGSLSDRPRPHPPHKKKPQAGAQNTTETQESETSKSKKKKSRTNTGRTSARNKKQSTETTAEIQSDIVKNLPETSETRELQTFNTKKSSHTKKTSKGAHSNKQSAVPSPDKLSGKDDKLPEVTQECQSSEANNSDSNKRGKKRTADVKLPEAEELIARVYKFLQAEYEFLKYYIGDICDLSPLTNVLKRTADACGVCKYTVRRIVDKTRSEGDQNVAGAVKRAKLRQQLLQVSSLAEEESSCDESEKEENKKEEEQDNKEMNSKIKVEKSSCSDSDNELDDEDKQMDDDSEESDECEVEAPNMDIDAYEVKPLDPLKTEPIEIMTESTDVGNTQLKTGSKKYRGIYASKKRIHYTKRRKR